MTNIETGVTKRLAFLGGGAGMGAGASRSWDTSVPFLSASGDFETSEWVDWNDFNCGGEVVQFAADAFIIGYSLSWAKFNSVLTDPGWISTRGLQSFGIALSGIGVVGRFKVLD